MHDVSLVNSQLPQDALPGRVHLPDRSAQRALGYPCRLNVCQELVDRHIRLGFGGEPAIRSTDGRMWTYNDLADQVSRMGGALRARGIRPGDRILLLLPNVAEFIIAWLAILRVGAVVVAANPLYRRRELKTILAEINPACVVSTQQLWLDEYSAWVPDETLVILVGEEGSSGATFNWLLKCAAPCAAAPTSPEDYAVIAYTSGSTGSPKGTCHTHGDILAIADTYAATVLQPARGDRCFCHSSMAFTYAVGGLLVFPLRFGACAVLEAEKFDADAFLDVVRRERVTILFSTPTACRMYLGRPACTDPRTWETVRLVVSAGEHLPGTVTEKWRLATGREILDGCGSTELLHIWISQRSGAVVPGCTGTPVHLYQAILLDEDGQLIEQTNAVGRLAVRGPTGCRYWKREGMQARTLWRGFTVTGDRFRRDANGYWHICRTDDLIVCGGYNIAPAEIEETLLNHPAVSDAAVVGIPDETRGEIPCAFIVSGTPTKRGERLELVLTRYLRDQLAVYKCPREFVVLDALPRTATGKFDRKALRALAATERTVQCPIKG